MSTETIHFSHDFMLGEDRQTDILMCRTIDIKIET